MEYIQLWLWIYYFVTVTLDYWNPESAKEKSWVYMVQSKLSELKPKNVNNW